MKSMIVALMLLSSPAFASITDCVNKDGLTMKISADRAPPNRGDTDVPDYMMQTIQINNDPPHTFNIGEPRDRRTITYKIEEYDKTNNSVRIVSSGAVIARVASKELGDPQNLFTTPIGFTRVEENGTFKREKSFWLNVSLSDYDKSLAGSAAVQLGDQTTFAHPSLFHMNKADEFKHDIVVPGGHSSTQIHSYIIYWEVSPAVSEDHQASL